MIEIDDKIGGLDIKSVHVWSLGPLSGPDLGSVGLRVQFQGI